MSVCGFQGRNFIQGEAVNYHLLDLMVSFPLKERTFTIKSIPNRFQSEKFYFSFEILLGRTLLLSRLIATRQSLPMASKSFHKMSRHDFNSSLPRRVLDEEKLLRRKRGGGETGFYSLLSRLHFGCDILATCWGKINFFAGTALLRGEKG